MRKEIESLRDQVLRRSELKTEIEELEVQLEKLEKELFSLKIDAHNQQADVDMLNMFSLKNLFYDVTGKKEALLQKETSEARTANNNYHTALFRFEQLNRQLESDRSELLSLRGCEDKYWNLLQEKLHEAQGSERMWILENITVHLDMVISDLTAAHSAGSDALRMTDGLLQNIKNVRDWNRNLSGSARNMTMQGYLNGTQKKIGDFRKQIRFFLRKLDGLPLPAPVRENADEIFIYPENYLQEVAGKLGAEERLCEADAAVKAADKRLKNILSQLENTIEQKKQEKEAVA